MGNNWKHIYVVYEISSNPHFNSSIGLDDGFSGEYTRPAEVNELICSINKLGLNYDIIDGPEELLKILPNVEELSLVINLSRGLTGLEKKIHVPSICDFYKIPYIGGSAYALTIGRHKFHSNLIMKSFDVRVPDAIYLQSPTDIKYKNIKYPVIVKPNNESNSMGIDKTSICFNEIQLRKKIQEISPTNASPVIVEKYLNGPEIKVSIIGNTDKINMIEAVEAVRNGGSLENSLITRLDNIERKISTQSISTKIDIEELKSQASKAFNALLCRDFARIDFRLDKNGKPYCIEVEHQPDLASDSAFMPAVCQSSNNPESAIKEILSQAWHRYFNPKTELY